MTVAAVCSGTRLLDFGSACVRDFWTALVPAVLVALLCIASIPLPSRTKGVIDFVKAPFRTYLTLEEAEAIDAEVSGENGTSAETQKPRTPLWRTLLLSWTALLLALAWLGVGSFRLFTQGSQNALHGVVAVVVALSWIYAAAKPALNPKPTPHYGLFALYIVFFISTVFVLGGYVYDDKVEGVPLPVTSVVVESINLALILLLLIVQLKTPLAIPSSRVKPEDIGLSVSAEDYTTLLGWITFHWVSPLIKRGTYNTLNESDIPRLSPTMQARPVFTKFSRIQRSSLLRRLWAANSLDLILDFVLTFTSVVFNYAGPFFLKRILESIDHPEDPRSRANAYIFAFLAFVATLCKAEADVQHLWYGRRAAVRVRSELMTSIYDKALKRKDFSGIVDKDKGKAAASPEEAKKRAKAMGKGKDTSDDPKAGADIGKIVNLMAGDANRCANLVSGAYFIYGAPFEIIIASIFLYQILGWSAFAGFTVLVAGWPLNSYIARRRIRIHKGVLNAQDKRMGVLNELITSIKLIKFMAWQDRWIKRVMDAREVEMQWMIKSRINSIFFSLLWTLAPILVSVVSFATYIYTGHELTVPVAFTAIALFSMIRQPLNVIPTWIVQVLQTLVAVNRIATYLGEDEVSEQVSSLKKKAGPPDDTEEKGLGIQHGSFRWNQVEEQKEDKPASPTDETDTAVDSASVNGQNGDHRFELKDIDVMFPDGALSVITGPTASGKTALLMALLGEMTQFEGKLVMSKDASRVDEHGNMRIISYAAQSPWLRHQSIRDNILFGYPYDEERYNEVIESCALTTDLDILEDGDATEIGARGVSLSGGQKARVALARAVYARTRYVLLDDPLSAVDSHTARVLFDKLLCGPLLANRTVILVTHHVELVLPGAQYLVRMLDGRIDTQGFIKDLRAQGVLEEITHDASADIKEGEKEAAEEAAVEAIEGEAAPATKLDDKAKKPRKLVKDEARETGSVKWHIYNTYLKASSYWTWGIIFFLIICSQCMTIVEKLWIMTWGDAYGRSDASSFFAFTSFATPEHEMPMEGSLSTQHLHNFNRVPTASGIQDRLPDAREHPFFYVAVYACIGLTSATISILSSVTNFTGALRASRRLFSQLLVSVVCATMRWHDVTPAGRMLNRFSKDIDTVDSSLAGSLQAVNSSLATFLASVIAVTVVFPTFLIPAVLIGLVYRHLAIGYLNTGRDLRRMESNSRSPIFSGFGELLEGIVTVRAFSAESKFLNDLFGKVDMTTKMWYNFWMTNRWLLLHFDALGALGVLITTLFALSGLVSAGLAGLCITSAMSFTTSVYWACRFWTALELDLNSVERVVEYLNLPQEPPAIIESHRPPAYWPSSTTQNPLISVQDLVVRYAPELPPVLHGVSFDLKPRERIGLLGRTGSGKSTLAMSILRFVDPASGKIVIDGIDISTIGLHDLRSRLTFIPQDATLFSGTLRENLDPFIEHTDEECLDVLFRVQMITESAYQSQRTSREASRAPSIHERESTSDSGSTSPTMSTTVTEVDAKTSINLDTQVSPGGTNFSQGQRQLIALARALLRRSSIIILDEATSSIDFATDAKIQQTIREEFGDSLLLTVAHRLRTVIDYDRLIVLDKGTIAEFDTPYNLLQNPDGIFRNMCLKSGSYSELEGAAKAKAGL
ncbi:multidrug resistance-associated ABC transporter [Punctularia strigosozonata HHB-11173 SS5]|uniref:Multidrug resistance-associated ABC transporter n=1 Tax=Punctularia strigosozonata (strain HHB-11173) TaxID=741275 RepID=R7S1C5_PUNST|nr:multidrug resistance-associated ABC transporter [Punctularia strigosozonata HHB-11173 SS5]EIN03587.1 multidrug resistance-associated ABC transporter [Punctularia strigosozonata HHB-11173 SS5]